MSRAPNDMMARDNDSEDYEGYLELLRSSRKEAGTSFQ